MSLVERVLQRDPAGVHGRMDFLCRDRYRQAVEELAEPTGGGPGPRRLAGGRERAPGGGEPRARRRARRARRPSPHREGPPRARGGRSLPSRAWRRLLRAVRVRPRDERLPRGDRALRPRRWSGPGSRTHGNTDGSTWEQIAGGAARCSCPRASWPSRSSSASRPASRRRGGCRASTSPRASPRTSRTLVVVPTLLTSVHGVEALRRARRGPRAREPRPARPLRDPRRLRRRRRTATCPDDAAILAAARNGDRAAERAARRRPTATGSSCSIARASGTPARARGWDGSGSAASSRS